MFNDIKGLGLVVAQFNGFSSIEEKAKDDARREKMRTIGKKGAQAKRAKEDPVVLAVKARARARANGCTDARSVAGWIKRYIDGGLKVANAGPDDRS